MSAHARYVPLILLAAGAPFAQPGPFEDSGFTVRSADNDPDLVVVRERFDRDTMRQSIYLRSYDGSADHTVHSGELLVAGARVAEVITDGAELTASDAMWGVGDLDYGPEAGRGLEGEVTGHVPLGRDTNDAIRVEQRRVRFWFGAARDVDDIRVILEFDEEPVSAHFDVVLFGGRRADPDGFPSTSQGGVHVGTLGGDEAPDDGDYSEVFEVVDIKLRIEDLDLVERTLSLGEVETDGPVGPARFTVDNFADETDVDQDNGFDQNGVLTPIPSATDLQNLELEVPDLTTERGDVIEAAQLMVVGLPAELAHGQRTEVEVSAVVPEGTPPGVYRGQLVVWEDNVTDGRRSAREPGDGVRISVVVGTPPDGGFDLGIPDSGLPDGFVPPPDAGPDGADVDGGDGADAGPDGGGEEAGADDGVQPDRGVDAGVDAGDGGGLEGGADGRVDGATDGLVDASDARADGGVDPDAADGSDVDAAPGAEPADLEPEVFDPGDARGGAFSCQSAPQSGWPGAWWVIVLAFAAVRIRLKVR